MGKASVEETLQTIIESIDYGHTHTNTTTVVLECTAGQGNSVGHELNHLATIVNGVKDQSRVGVCLDTAHLFSAGYDLRGAEQLSRFIDEFDEIVGLDFLRGIHTFTQCYYLYAICPLSVCFF